jgi:hypothetical protein
MAQQPTAPVQQPPPDLPSMPDVSAALTGYLRTFALWCRNGFAAKLDNGSALPGLMLQAYGVAANNPPVFMLEVTPAGQLMLVPMALGSGAKGTAAPVVPAPVGVTDGSNAPAGQIGEFLTATRTITPVTGSYDNVVQMTLTPGDWDVWGAVYFQGATFSNVQVSVSTSPTAASLGVPFVNILVHGVSGPPSNVSLIAPQVRLNVTAPTPIYLLGFAAFTAPGAVTAVGFLSARRAR